MGMLFLILKTAFIFGFWNGVRGRGFFAKHKILSHLFGRIACCVYLGITLRMVMPAEFAANAALCFFFAILFGWGKYFMAFTGMNVLHERENPWVDWCVDKIMDYTPGRAYSPAYCRKYGVWGMSLVGLQFMPVFLWPLLYAPHAAWLNFVPLVCLSMGFVYGGIRYLRDKTSAAPAEIVFASIVGAAYGLVISVVFS